MKNVIKKFITNGFIIYASIILAYILFFFLVIYFKNILHDVHDAYTIAINLIAILNLNIMSVVFIKRFNKINRKINYIIDVLDVNYEEDEKG